MAVKNPSSQSQGGSASGGRRVLVGTNVVVTIVLAVAVVGVLQAIAYNAPSVKVDMTSTGVNSLSEGTLNLLKGLDQNVTLTSLYFETDLEEEEQPLYRRAVKDLLGLFESAARSKVRADWINPLSDHEKFKELQTRLREKDRFKKELEPYAAAIEKYQKDLDARARALVQQELDTLGTMTGPMADAETKGAVGQVEVLFQRWSQELESGREQIDGLMAGVTPQHTAVTRVLETLYRDFSKALKDVTQFGQAQVARSPGLPESARDYLSNAGGRFAELVSTLEGEVTTLQELEPLSIDKVLREFEPNANPIVVETDAEALVVG